jgi:hypothetical protein
MVQRTSNIQERATDKNFRKTIEQNCDIQKSNIIRLNSNAVKGLSTKEKNRRARNPERLFKDLSDSQKDYIGEVDEQEIHKSKKIASSNRAKSQLGQRPKRRLETLPD